MSPALHNARNRHMRRARQGTERGHGRHGPLGARVAEGQLELSCARTQRTGAVGRGAWRRLCRRLPGVLVRGCTYVGDAGLIGRDRIPVGDDVGCGRRLAVSEVPVVLSVRVSERFRVGFSQRLGVGGELCCES